MPRPLIGIDVGGTFTDLCLWDGRSLRVAKTPSTPDDFVRGICDGLALLGLGGGDDASHAGPSHGAADLIHGSTVATNALLERKGDRIAFLTTAGFEDLLLIGRQDRPNLYALWPRRPPPLVRRDDCFGVTERIAADGGVVTRMNVSHLDETLAAIKARGIESIAVCLLFSFLNPQHERIVVERAEALGLNAYASCDVLPEFREYERAATTVANAYVAGRMRRYLDRLESALRPLGIASVRVMQSNGGQLGAKAAGRHAVRTILSGPAGGVVAARRIAGELGLSRIITYDMGGTSTDVALCDGDILTRTDTVISGVPIAVPMLAIHTVGAGGGSSATVDAGGALRVGPESAGADPGPACYGRGVQPTVTDAHVVLGRIRPDLFLGGRFPLDAGRSHAAMQALAAQMGCNEFAAAQSMIAVCSANMEHALSVVSAQQGYDPGDFWLISFGGAGGLHACELAASLGMRGVVVPAHGGILSACGLAAADIVMDFSASLPRGSGGVDLAGVRRTVSRLMDDAARAITAEGYDLDDAECDRFIDLRYVGQGYELTVPIATLADAASLVEPFHALHAKRFGFSAPDRPVEAVTVRVRARIPMPTFSFEPAPTAGPSPMTTITAPCWFDEMCETPFVPRDALETGRRINGPLVLTDAFSTTLVPPDWCGELTRGGHIRLNGPS